MNITLPYQEEVTLSYINKARAMVYSELILIEKERDINNNINNNNNNININIPDDMQPPYIAFVGNIPTALPESEVKNIFEPNNKVINIKVTTQEKSTFAFIEFGSINDLRNAINLSGKQVKNRNIKVDLASEGQKANMEKYMISRRNNNNNNNLNNKYNNNNIINRNTVRYPVPLEGVGLRISNTKY
eukprot:Tbor_TRINITY_DN5967_c2_g1::TRINITY_DN5967_c2_g1_i15::g.19070::m.19070